MICRRCGMESSATDKCEWCKKPMLPPGGAISAKAKEELIKAKEAAAKAPEEQQQAAPPESRETADEAMVRRPESKPPPPPPEFHASGLLTLGADLASEEEASAETPNYIAGKESSNEEILRPLGAQATPAQGEEAKDTPLYIGDDESVLRPIERPAGKDGARYFIDSTGRKRRMADSTPEIPDKVRLLRGAMQGAIFSLALALIEFVVLHKMPMRFIVIPIAGYESFSGAILYGVLAAVFYGFMFSAVLVQFRKGPVVGFLAGAFLLGWLAMLNEGSGNMPWSMINGAVCGILCGRSSVKGLKRVVTV